MSQTTSQVMMIVTIQKLDSAEQHRHAYIHRHSDDRRPSWATAVQPGTRQEAFISVNCVISSAVQWKATAIGPPKLGTHLYTWINQGPLCVKRDGNIAINSYGVDGQNVACKFCQIWPLLATYRMVFMICLYNGYCW